MKLPAQCLTMLGLLALSFGCAAAQKTSAPAYDDYAYEDAVMGSARDVAEKSQSMSEAAPMGADAMASPAPAAAVAQPTAVMGSLPPRASAEGDEAGSPQKAIADDDDMPTTGTDAVDQMLVFNGALSLQTEHGGIRSGIDSAVDFAVRAGGYIAQQTDTSVTLRVPSKRFRKLMRQVEGLGDVHSRSVHTLDVSEEFHDLKVRLDNLESTRARIEKLLAQAKSLSEVLTVEKELERVSAEIDRIQGRMRFLSSQAAFSTLTIGFTEKPAEVVVIVEDDRDIEPPPPPPPPPPRVLRSNVDWVGDVGVHRLMALD
ncbi:MAG: DUF4349 domain-containing protein [Myxococcota bacterium]